MKRFLAIAFAAFFVLMAFHSPALLFAADETSDDGAETAVQDSGAAPGVTGDEASEPELRNFVCPSCGYTGDKPGDCPGCKVPLVEDLGGQDSASASAGIEDPDEEPSPLLDKGPEPPPDPQ